MNVVLYRIGRNVTGVQGRKRTKYRFFETQILEELPDDPDGRLVATVKDHALAKEIAAQMGWTVTYDSGLLEEEEQ